MKPHSKALQEGHLRDVPQRRAAWVSANSDVEPDDRPDSRELDRGGIGMNAAFDPSDLRVREADRSTDHVETQASADPRGTDVHPQVEQVPTGDP